WARQGWGAATGAAQRGRVGGGQRRHGSGVLGCWGAGVPGCQGSHLGGHHHQTHQTQTGGPVPLRNGAQLWMRGQCGRVGVWWLAGWLGWARRRPWPCGISTHKMQRRGGKEKGKQEKKKGRAVRCLASCGARGMCNPESLAATHCAVSAVWMLSCTSLWTVDSPAASTYPTTLPVAARWYT
ncbi:hypothetical protein BDZ91DRAFT_835125, partial [Kalaharituber pfeilii]